MPGKDDDKELGELESTFDFLGARPGAMTATLDLRRQDLEWKNKDPDGYKKDLEEMCKAMCGDKWEDEYQALLLEEFPDESAD